MSSTASVEQRSRAVHQLRIALTHARSGSTRAAPSAGTVQRQVGRVRDALGSASVVALISDQGKSRQVLARELSIGVNTVGLALMVAVFAHTCGLTGG